MEEQRFILVQKKRCICDLTFEGGKEQGYQNLTENLREGLEDASRDSRRILEWA